MKVLPQIRLRTLFLVFVCAAVGLTCATAPPRVDDPFLKAFGFSVSQLNYHYALLAAAAMAIVIGLIEQSIALRRWQPQFSLNDCGLGFARSFAISWRVALSILIAACLLGRVLLSRQVLKLPEHSDLMPYQVFPDKILLIAIFVVLVDSLRRWQIIDRQRQRLWADALVWILGLCLALFDIWPDSGLITFLVHIATQGIESAERFHRPGVFPNHQLEHFRTYWTSFAAVIAVVLAAALLVRGQSAKSSRAMLFAFSFLYASFLGGAAVFCIWFYQQEFPRVSPDMASVGFASNWLDRVGGSIIVAILVTAAAYRLSVNDSDGPTCNVANARSGNSVAFHESAMWFLLLLGAAVLYCVETLRGNPALLFQPPNMFESVGYFLRSPDSYLMMALAVLSLQLCWVKWKQRNNSPISDLRAVDHSRFAWTWLAAALLATVGLPTVAIYCFTFWLGPWYLYGS